MQAMTCKTHEHRVQAMAYTIRLQDELGHELKRRREAARLTKSALAQRAGKVREVVYRLEAGGRHRGLAARGAGRAGAGALSDMAAAWRDGMAHAAPP